MVMLNNSVRTSCKEEIEIIKEIDKITTLAEMYSKGIEDGAINTLNLNVQREIDNEQHFKELVDTVFR